VGYEARMEKVRNMHKISVEKLEGKIPFGKPLRRRDDIIKKDLQKIESGSV